MNKIILFSFLLLWSNSILSAQQSCGIVNKDSIDSFIEEAFIKNNVYLKERISYRDSIRKNNFDFFKKQINWATKMVAGGCLSAAEQRVLEHYLHYIENEITEIDNDLSSTIEVSKTAFHELTQKKLLQYIAKLQKENHLKLIFDQAHLLYLAAEVHNYTDQIIYQFSSDANEIIATFSATTNTQPDKYIDTQARQHNLVDYNYFRNSVLYEEYLTFLLWK